MLGLWSPSIGIGAALEMCRFQMLDLFRDLACGKPRQLSDPCGAVTSQLPDPGGGAHDQLPDFSGTPFRGLKDFGLKSSRESSIREKKSFLDISCTHMDFWVQGRLENSKGHWGGVDCQDLCHYLGHILVALSPELKGTVCGCHQWVSPSSLGVQVIRLHLTWAAGRYTIPPLTEVQCFSVLPVSHVPA